MSRVVRSVNHEPTSKLALVLEYLDGVGNGILVTREGDAGRSCERISTVMNRRRKGGEPSVCFYNVSSVSETSRLVQKGIKGLYADR
jgi:hypothetical protein